MLTRIPKFSGGATEQSAQFLEQVKKLAATTIAVPLTYHVLYKPNVSYYKPGTSMQDNIHLAVRPPKKDGGFCTIMDAARSVLAYGRAESAVTSCPDLASPPQQGECEQCYGGRKIEP